LLFARILERGTYVRVSCEINMHVIEEPPPPPATNYDCAHAKPLPSSTTTFPQAPSAQLFETRVGDELPRFYSFSISYDPYLPNWRVRIVVASDQTGAGAELKLHGQTTSFEQGGSIHTLDGEQYAEFDPIPADDYCVELKTAVGAKYSAYYTVVDSPP
jgi:hypothetical protein